MEYNLKEMKIEVTKECPLACIHCSSNSSASQKEEIAKDKCFTIISEAKSLGVNEISFSGGEPLICDYIIDAIQYCTDNNIETTVYTSGNVDKAEDMFKKLSEAGLSKVIFSVYSNDENEHNQVTRKINSFNKTIDSIGIANRFNIETEIHFVALKKSFRNLRRIAEMASQLGVSKVSVLRFVPQGRGAMLSVMTKSENLELKKEIEKLVKSGYSIRTGSPYNFLLLNEEPKCMASRDRLIISPTLDIYPCDAFKQIKSKDIVGTEEYSSLEHSTLAECWEKSKYFEMVRSAQEQEPRDSCKECHLYVQCIGGCLAQEYIAFNTLKIHPDPACLNRN